MPYNATTANSYMKRRFVSKFVENALTSTQDPMYKAMSKNTDGSGEQNSFLFDGDDSFGVSADFVISQTAASTLTATVGSRFLFDWSNASEVAQVTSDIIGKTRNNDGAWQKAIDMAMKKKMNAFNHFNSVLQNGQGWGEVSQITSVSGSTFVPLIRSDITKYVKGMPLHFSQLLNTTLLRSATVVYVTAVSYTLGSELVTLSATLASVSAVNNDFAFIAGVRQDSATPSRLAWIGLDGWVPNQIGGVTDATLSTLGGVNRALNSRLYGTFIDATGTGSILGALIDGVQEAGTVGNATRVRCFASKSNFATVAKDLQNAVRYDNSDARSKTVGTNKLLIYSDGQCEGTLEVSRTLNDNKIFGFDPSIYVLDSIGTAPHIESDDGLTMGRVGNAAAWEVRWFQQACSRLTNPPAALRIQLV
jgi:hypothetical protein